ncbi:uncharacterized protein [Anabrus simplex]|uniref:uncharacterized protein n=1 Tax=Anabrus simplex TaxID=316456 RepID=UPI0035A35FAF
MERCCRQSVFMMTMVLGMIVGLLSTTMAYGMYRGRGKGVSICNGMVCPSTTGCYGTSSYANEVLISKNTCFNVSGSTVKEEITAEVDDGAGYFLFKGGNIVMCVVTSDMTGKTLQTTKVCQDDNGEFRPMTPEEEQEFERHKAEAEAAGKIAQEKGRKQYEEAMRNAKKSIEEGHRLRAAAQEHAKRMEQQAMENMMRINANIQHMMSNQQREMARQLEEAAAARERAQAEHHKIIAEAQQEHERRMKGFLQSFPNIIGGQVW